MEDLKSLLKLRAGSELVTSKFKQMQADGSVDVLSLGPD
jgi:hypothetical protein